MGLWACNLGGGFVTGPKFFPPKKNELRNFELKKQKNTDLKIIRGCRICPFFFFLHFRKKGCFSHRCWWLDFLKAKATTQKMDPTGDLPGLEDDDLPQLIPGWVLPRISFRKQPDNGRPFLGAFWGWFERWPSNGRVYIYTVNIYRHVVCIYIYIYAHIYWVHGDLNMIIDITLHINVHTHTKLCDFQHLVKISLEYSTHRFVDWMNGSEAGIYYILILRTSCYYPLPAFEKKNTRTHTWFLLHLYGCFRK